MRRSLAVFATLALSLALAGPSFGARAFKTGEYSGDEGGVKFTAGKTQIKRFRFTVVYSCGKTSIEHVIRASGIALDSHGHFDLHFEHADELHLDIEGKLTGTSGAGTIRSAGVVDGRKNCRTGRVKFFVTTPS